MKTLIIFSHSYFAASKVNRKLLDAVSDLENVTIRNLEELYGTDPTKIDVKAEQKLIESHDRLVFQHPVFWFNMTPMLKGYIDRVFEHGWAYGSEGHALKDKHLQLVLSTGARQEDYTSPSIGEFFLAETAVGNYTGMIVDPIYVVYGCLSITDQEIEKAGQNYRQLLTK